MLSILISLLVALLVLFLIYYIVTYALGIFGAPAPVIKIVQLIFLLIAIIYIIGALTGSVPSFI